MEIKFDIYVSEAVKEMCNFFHAQPRIDTCLFKIKIKCSRNNKKKCLL